LRFVTEKIHTSNAGARLYAICDDSRPLIKKKNRFASELTRILNEYKFDEYVHLHCLQILYE